MGELLILVYGQLIVV